MTSEPDEKPTTEMISASDITFEKVSSLDVMFNSETIVSENRQTDAKQAFLFYNILFKKPILVGADANTNIRYCDMPFTNLKFDNSNYNKPFLSRKSLKDPGWLFKRNSNLAIR